MEETFANVTLEFANFSSTVKTTSFVELIDYFLDETTIETLSGEASFNNSLNETVSNATEGGRGGGVLTETTNISHLRIARDDVAWILTATFIIFTMQTGFGLLEAGCVSMKNESNIMIKNVVDVVLGGFTYWLFGYGLSFGKSSWTNPLFGWGDFALNASEDVMGVVYTTFFFQLSFATTATTIVSGAVAERFRFSSYIIFSAVNTIIYCIPAGWIWGSHGFLYNLGAIDIAGSCAVHLCGGASALVASYMVGPRLGRYDYGEEPLPMGSPTSSLLGMFMLWWGWLGFNCGSSFGIRGHKWKYVARTAVMTLQSSLGGGLAGMTISMIRNNKMMMVPDVVNSILGSLVSVTAGCALYTTWEALFVGLIGGSLTILTLPLFDKLHIDDPVGAVSVHGVCGLWAMISTGLFVKQDKFLNLTKGRSGLFRGGGFSLLGVQCLASLCTVLWSMVLTFLLLKTINRFISPIRMSEWEELVGADFAEHGIRRKAIGISRAVSVLGFDHEGKNYQDFPSLGDNPCHQAVLNEVKNLNSRRPSSITKAVSLALRKPTSITPSISVNGDITENGKRWNSRFKLFKNNVKNAQVRPQDDAKMIITDLENTTASY